jgi:stearoyl-CoA desaturase (Delta-9 desaturase)
MLRTAFWFDADLVESILEPGKFDYWRIIPLVLLHIGCFLAFYVGTSKTALVVAGLSYFLRMFAITGFYHRYFAHKTFKTNRFWQFIFAFIGASAAQRGALWWASHHRAHHRHADKKDDLHSPLQHGFLWSHMGWFFSSDAFKTNYKAVSDLAKFPELRWLNRFDTLVAWIYALGLYTLGCLLEKYYPSLHTNGMQLLVWGFFIATVLVFHATCSINSLAHKFGTKPFATPDNSRNNLLLAIVTLGEGWHNNHHFYCGSARQGFYWWQIDITFYLLWVLAKLGLIYDLRPVRLPKGNLT